MSQSIPSTYRGVYSRWFYLPAATHLRHLLPHADCDLVLLRIHQMDPVRLGVDRIRELRTVLQGTGADQRTAEHDHLCRRDEQPQGRARSAAGSAADVEDPRTRPDAHRWCSSPCCVSTVAIGVTFSVLLHPSDGLVNVVARRRRHRRPGLADRHANRLAVGGARRCLEGCRARHADLHRRHRVDPHWSTSRPSRSTGVGSGNGCGT